MKIVNIVMCGEFPFIRKLNTEEVNKLIEKGWILSRQESSPLLIRRIEVGGFNSKGYKKNVSLSLNMNGKIVLAGLIKRKQGNYVYSKALEEIEKNTKVIPKDV
jgi:nickel-dependent lactate racemase